MPDSNRFKLIVSFTVLCLLLLFLPACETPAPWEPEGFTPLEPDAFDLESIADLNEIVVPLNGISPGTAEDGDLASLDDYAGAELFALGMASYGTRELVNVTHRIFKYMVKNHGYRTLIVEFSYAESLAFERYITTGAGNLDDILINHIDYWAWKTSEFTALLEWMRIYNQERPPGDKIHIYGIQNKSAPPNVPFLVSYLEQWAPGLFVELAPALEEARGLDEISYYGMTREEADEILGRLQTIYDSIEARREELAPLSGTREYEEALQSALCILHGHKSQFNSTPLGGYYDGTRLGFIADTTLWACRLSGQGAKAFLWTYLSTVNFSPSNASRSLGVTLRKELGTAYRSFGLLFSLGEFYAIREDNSNILYELTVNEAEYIPSKESLNFLFHSASNSRFILRIKDIPLDSDLYSWLTEHRPRYFLSIPGTYDGTEINYYGSGCILPNSFDGVIYIDTVNAAELLFGL